MPKALEPKEIRELYTDFKSDWREIYEEGDTDIRYVSGDPWSPDDRAAREDADRPCVSQDEINQYLNQAINNVRQNKRAIQVNPKGSGANDKDAEHRGNIIRGIERRSQAQSVYITAFENQIQRAIGFAVLRTNYESEDSFNQEILIKGIANPKTVLIDSNYKQADASDIENGFITDLIRKEDFKRKYPKAKLQSFTSEHMTEAPNWVRERYVQIAEFWRVTKTPEKLLLVQTPEGVIPLRESELTEVKGRFSDLQVIKERTVERKEVVQYIFNGLEIIDETRWAGSYIPILSCLGKEIYIADGGDSKRMLLSMVRLARDPQMTLAYMVTQEMEEAAMSPKSPVMGYVGQFETDEDAWKMLNKIPRAYIQVDPTVDSATGQLLPLPTRPQFIPNFQAYEVGKESARRAIQSAMGIMPMPTSAQRRNEKSGVALAKIQEQESIGSFHFTDNFDRFLENAGRQVNELIEPIMDTARDVPVVKPDGTASILRINDEAYEVKNPNKDHLHTDKGEYGVTIKVGPSNQSQREIADEFVDHLIANLKGLPIAPPVAQKILALAIKLKTLGPIGDEISQLLDPGDQNDIPPQAQAQIAQYQAQLQMASAELQKLQFEKAAKQWQMESQAQIAQLQGDIKVLVALIEAKNQNEAQEAEMYKTFWVENHHAAHERGLQEDEQQHQHAIADKQAQAASDQQASQQAHEATQSDADRQAQAEQAAEQPQ